MPRNGFRINAFQRSGYFFGGEFASMQRYRTHFGFVVLNRYQPRYRFTPTRQNNFFAPQGPFYQPGKLRAGFLQTDSHGIVVLFPSTGRKAPI